MPDALSVFTVIFLIIIGTFAWGAVRGAPWVPTRRCDIARVVALANLRPGERVADLGCGSGGVLAAFAAAGGVVSGWELAIAPWLLARWRARRWPNSRLILGDFWDADLFNIDVVYAFLMPKALPKLAAKLHRELRPGARIITYVWPLPGWSPTAIDRSDGASALYLFRV